MKKCLKCGNNVLPGTSTCPGCGNAIRNNTNTKQSFTPSAKKTVDYTPRRVHDTVSPNTAGYNSSANGSGIVAVIIILIFIFIPLIIFFNIAKYEYKEFNEETEELFENVYNDNEDEYIDPYDYVFFKSAELTELGEIVMFFENTYTEPLGVDVDLKYLDDLGSELSQYQRFGYMDIAPKTEQVMVFTSVNTSFRSYKYSYDPTDGISLGVTTINMDNIKTNDTGEKLITTYFNDSDEDLEMVELCVLYYNDDKLMHAACGRDYNIEQNEELMIEFNYSYEAKYKGLVFNKYVYYLHDAQSE